MDHSFEDGSLPSGKAAGSALVAASLLSLAFVAHHPVVRHRGAAEFVEEMAQKAFADALVHGSLLVLMALLLYGLSCLAARLGLHRFCPRAGLIAYALGAFLVSIAAVIDGFVIHDLTSRFEGRPTADLESLRHLLTFCAVFIRACSRIWVVATSVAVALWSIELLRYPGLTRVVGALGCLAGAAPVVALLSGNLPMNVHGLLLFIGCQTIWNAAVAWLLFQRRV